MKEALKKTLEAQLQVRNDGQEDLSSSQDTTSYLTFRVDEHDFCLLLSEVKEVLDMQPITPYPVRVKGHLGLLNLRGKVIPVIAPFEKMMGHTLTSYNTHEYEKLNQEQWRLIVFEHEDSSFALLSSSVKKRMGLVSDSAQDLIQIDDHPYKMFSAKNVIQQYKESA